MFFHLFNERVGSFRPRPKSIVAFRKAGHLWRRELVECEEVAPIARVSHCRITSHPHRLEFPSSPLPDIQPSSKPPPMVGSECSVDPDRREKRSTSVNLTHCTAFCSRTRLYLLSGIFSLFRLFFPPCVNGDETPSLPLPRLDYKSCRTPVHPPRPRNKVRNTVPSKRLSGNSNVFSTRELRI